MGGFSAAAAQAVAAQQQAMTASLVGTPATQQQQRPPAGTKIDATALPTKPAGQEADNRGAGGAASKILTPTTTNHATWPVGGTEIQPHCWTSHPFTNSKYD